MPSSSSGNTFIQWAGPLFPLGLVALAGIESVSTWAPLWNEHWCNTLWARGRVVCLRRKTGWLRNFIITPAHRDAFIAELRQRLGTPS